VLTPLRPHVDALNAALGADRPDTASVSSAAAVEFALDGEPLSGITDVRFEIEGAPGEWHCDYGVAGGDYEASCELTYTDGGRGYRRLWAMLDRERKAFEATQRGCAEGAARWWARYARGQR
jgi:hypothetical protein